MSGRSERTPMLDLLQGIRVVSFNHFLLGPMGIQALADLGADVIAIESPAGAWQRHWSSGDIWHNGQGMLHVCTNRNKRSLALDLKAPKGREIALKLIDSADVLAENFRPGVMEKLGFGYEVLRQRKAQCREAAARRERASSYRGLVLSRAVRDLCDAQRPHCGVALPLAGTRGHSRGTAPRRVLRQRCLGPTRRDRRDCRRAAEEQSHGGVDRAHGAGANLARARAGLRRDRR